MKSLVGFIAMLVPLSVFAENYQGMSEDQMQNMLQQMEGVQTCVQAIDPSEMEAFEQRAQLMQDEVNALCADGQRDVAMAKAMAFAKEVSTNKVMQAMRKCGEGMVNTMPKIVTSTENSASQHVCDE